MATNLLPIHATGVRASAVSGQRGSDNLRRKTPITGDADANASWWSPLFGWSTNADYIVESSSSKNKGDSNDMGLKYEKHSDLEQKLAKLRFVPGGFTEEKAKQLRLKMAMESGAFHDVMYHSAIASRLASDFSRRRSDGQ